VGDRDATLQLDSLCIDRLLGQSSPIGKGKVPQAGSANRTQLQALFYSAFIALPVGVSFPHSARNVSLQ